MPLFSLSVKATYYHREHYTAPELSGKRKVTGTMTFTQY